ncbi:lipopolysaccharide export system protein LptC [Cellvibrio zantedeschiae]|uniref:Lipopolysaccharide export system protein LptC n=1 Tax=Cellvibrio zantedeschiae TaxID=1237077 RepID=A0ABQ3ATA7_9GAMM|nr:LPS export ABC transporter periplasmic protein LptC [Cellvibrio zantedeschiae]GGY63914.1 lipopolysaccharide export system protein LptC [Cellvibrio zantedeschiae]
MSKLHLPTINSANLERINPLLLPLPWLVVIVLVILFATLRYSSKENLINQPQADVKIFPHSYITNVEMRQYDGEGNIHYQMTTPLIRRFQVKENPSDKDYSLFETPVFMVVNNPQKPGWFITAQEGRLDNNDTWFSLTQEVVARQTSEKQGETTITTSDLRLNIQDQFAQTGKAVTMRAAKSQITAVGMRADMKRERIELLSNVKGTYEP